MKYALLLLEITVCYNVIQQFEDMAQNPVYFDFFLIYVFYFIYFLLCWVFVAARGLSLVAMSRGYSSLRCAGSRHGGFSSCASRALECRLSSCGSWASLLRGMWDLPGQGLNPCPLHWQADS